MDADQGMAANGQSGWPNASMDGCAFIQIERCGHTLCRMPIAFQARANISIYVSASSHARHRAQFEWRSGPPSLSAFIRVPPRIA